VHKKKSSGSHQEALRKSSGNPQEVLRKSSGSPQEALRKPSGSPQEALRTSLPKEALMKASRQACSRKAFESSQ
jgi:hypothetical protein